MANKTKIEMTFGEAMDMLIKGMDLKTDQPITVTANYANNQLSGVTVEFDNPVIKKKSKASNENI